MEPKETFDPKSYEVNLKSESSPVDNIISDISVPLDFQNVEIQGPNWPEL
jgi:hypothetical protein